MDERYGLDGLEDYKPSPEELEKKRQTDREIYGKASKFKKLLETEEWKECEKVLKEDIYKNLHYDKQYLHMCWGLKMAIDRMHAWAAQADILLKEYGGDI